MPMDDDGVFGVWFGYAYTCILRLTFRGRDFAQNWHLGCLYTTDTRNLSF